MTSNRPFESTEPNSRPVPISSQSHSLREEDNRSRPNRKQLDVEGIRELILEMRI